MIELDVDVVKPVPHGHAIGIDAGIQSMIATSDGLILSRPKFLDKALRKIELLQTKLRNKKKGSNKWKKLQHRIALLHEAVANKRKEDHFNLAHKLCDGVGMIFVGSPLTPLNKGGTKGGIWSKGLFCKQSLDMGLGQFFNILEYVCSKTDTFFAKVDKNYTSQICPSCGVNTGKKDLSTRIHNCFECGYVQDRDIAASEVIKDRGLENIAVGAPVIKRTGAVLGFATDDKACGKPTGNVLPSIATRSRNSPVTAVVAGTTLVV